jgi:hypothetical protein
MHTFYKRALFAGAATIGASLGGLILAGVLPAQAQSNFCITSGEGANSAGSGIGQHGGLSVSGGLTSGLGVSTGSSPTGTGTSSGTGSGGSGTGTGTGTGTSSGTGSGGSGTGTGTGTSSGSGSVQPLVTVSAPINSALTTTNPETENSVAAPLSAVVGNESSPNQQGSLLAVNSPTTLNGSTGTAGGTSLVTVNSPTTVSANGQTSSGGPASVMTIG